MSSTKSEPHRIIKELQPISDALTNSHDQLRRTVAGMTEDAMRVPFPGRDWSIHSVLAHLAGNEALMTELAKDIALGRRTNLPDDFDNDQFNAESVAARRDQTVQVILQEIDRNQQGLREFLSQVEPAQLERRGTHPLHGELTLREFLPVIYSHRVTHTREMAEQARRLKGSANNRT